MLVELHLLTSHAPASLNRDDAGRPKTALFGGVERARISSQAQKRAIRSHGLVRGYLTSDLSNEYPFEFYREIAEAHPDADPKRLEDLCQFFGESVGKVKAISTEDKRKLLTDPAVRLTGDERDQVRTVLVRYLQDGTNPRKADKKAENAQGAMLREMGLSVKPKATLDLALFGRMMTDKSNAVEPVDGSMQVAHAISTHAATTETDYFVAVDDLRTKRGERGTGHIGDSDFVSAVFYKYFSCNLDALIDNRGTDRDEAIKALIFVLDAACRVTPSGKQNSFASHSLADVALLVLRDQHVPCSLANAFETPVESLASDGTERGYLAPSARALVERYETLCNAYGLDDRATLFSIPDVPDTDAVTRVRRLADLWDALRDGAAAPAPGTATDPHADAFDAA